MQEIVNIYLQNPIGQTFGLIGMLIAITGFLQEDDKSVIKILLISNTFWGFHFLFMGLYTGVALVIVSLIRLYLSTKYKKDMKIYSVIFICTALIGLYTYVDYTSIFPIIGSLLATYAFFYLEKIKLRIVLLVSSSFWLSYNYINFSIGGVITESFIHVAHLITIYKIIVHEGDLSTYTDRFKSIFIKIPKIDYDRYLAIIDFIKIRKHKNIFK